MQCRCNGSFYTTTCHDALNTYDLLCRNELPDTRSGRSARTAARRTGSGVWRRGGTGIRPGKIGKRTLMKSEQSGEKSAGGMIKEEMGEYRATMADVRA